MKRAVRYSILAWIVTGVICFSLLLLSTLIPKQAIDKQCKNSASWFSANELFPELMNDQFNTRVDNYADCILTNIMYYMDGSTWKEKSAAVIRASYYDKEKTEVNESFRQAVETNIQPNTDYFRYWHGSIVLLRPLFLFTDITGARMIMGILSLLLWMACIGILIKRRKYALACSLFLALVLMQVWVICFCVEYVTTFLLAGGAALFVTASFHQKMDSCKRFLTLCVLFTIVGVLTCFMDFLTTETLTFTMPILIELVLEQEEKHKILDFKKTGILGIIWGLAYAGMFLTKWILAAVTLGRTAFMQAMEAAGERIGGVVYTGNSNLTPQADTFSRLMGALTRNESMFFPFQKTANVNLGAVGFWVILLLGFSVVYLFRKKEFTLKEYGLLFVPAVLPYIRYLALSNHAYIHYFFTYRAQLVTVTLFLYFVWMHGLKNLFHKG